MWLHYINVVTRFIAVKRRLCPSARKSCHMVTTSYIYALEYINVDVLLGGYQFIIYINVVRPH